jgi:hypothetical protein
MRKQLATVATAGVVALATVGGVLVGASLGGPEQRTISAATELAPESAATTVAAGPGSQFFQLLPYIEQDSIYL